MQTISHKYIMRKNDNSFKHIPLKDPVVDLNLKPKENWDT